MFISLSQTSSCFVLVPIVGLIANGKSLMCVFIQVLVLQPLLPVLKNSVLLYFFILKILQYHDTLSVLFIKYFMSCAFQLLMH